MPEIIQGVEFKDAIEHSGKCHLINTSLIFEHRTCWD